MEANESTHTPAHHHGDHHGPTHGDGHGDGHGHGDDHAGGHGHGRGDGLRHRLTHLLTPHGHETADKVDAAMETSREGMRTLWASLAVLGVTTAVQAVIVVLSGSVALLGDTVHNAADALTAVPWASPSSSAAGRRTAVTPTVTAGPRTWRAC